MTTRKLSSTRQATRQSESQTQNNARWACPVALAAILWVVSMGPARAQDIRSWTAPENSTLPRQVEWAQHHASTIEEGRLRGRADLEAARGEAYKNHQIGENYRQEAEYKRMQNELVKVNTRFEKRELNKRYRFAAAHGRAQQRKQGYAADAPQPAQATKWVSLFDPQTQQPRWPVALQDARYASDREAIEDVFQAFSPYEVGVGSVAYRRVQRATERIRGQLRGQIRELPAKEYLATKRFLNALVDSVEHPADTARIAVK